jgi:hypothetical protein
MASILNFTEDVGSSQQQLNKPLLFAAHYKVPNRSSAIYTLCGTPESDLPIDFMYFLISV